MDTKMSVLCLLLCLGFVNCVYENINGAFKYYNSNVQNTCRGKYCGRMPGNSTCRACPRGYSPDMASLCVQCNSSPTFYDWLYLGFMSLTSLVLHWSFIDFLSRPKRGVLLLHLSALVESVLAAVITLLLCEPVGSFEVRSCPVNQFSDWYSMFFNPTQDYYNTDYCTQEIVYPLYSMVMIYYVFSLVFMMLFRPILSYRLQGCQGQKSIYAALYFLPILILIHAVLAGVIYYAFPYVVVVVSVITSACHLATEENQVMKDLIKQNVTNIRNLTILLGHWALHAYGIMAITQLVQPAYQAPLVALVPFPTIFYILTVKFTDPAMVYPFSTITLQGA
ncbi:JNK1/MAPK8-associated membrane protein [Biomphalaria glabrata]|nr:JNK1/MAPK8-associated membrane protein-like [Biomphalaria glabrata]